MSKCQAAAFFDKDEIVPCSNEAGEIRRITFGNWHVYAALCTAHTELWDALDQTPMIVKKVGRKRKPNL
jgi:hypothetical protein